MTVYSYIVKPQNGGGHKEVSLEKRIQDEVMRLPSIRRLGKEKDPVKNTNQE